MSKGIEIAIRVTFFALLLAFLVSFWSTVLSWVF